MTMETVDDTLVGRRTLLKGSVALAGLWPLPTLADAISTGALPDNSDRLRSGQGVEATRQGAVALISLNRPSQGNVLLERDFADLLAAFRNLDDDASIQATVLVGRGEHFSRGIVAPSSQIEEMLAMGRTLSTKPVVAVVQGQTVGFGTVLPLCADVRVAIANTVFSWPDADHADIVRARLAEEIGRANAQRFLLTGDGLDAHEAWRLGLVQHIAATSIEAKEKAMTIAAAIARRRVERRGGA